MEDNRTTSAFVTSPDDVEIESEATMEPGENMDVCVATIHAERMFGLTRSEISPFALRLARATADAVFQAEFRKKVLICKKNRETKNSKNKTVF